MWDQNSQGRFYVGAGGNCPPNLGLTPPPKCDMKTLFDELKHRHIGAKKSVAWPSKYAKMRFPDHAEAAHEDPQTPRWPTRLFWWLYLMGVAPKYFSLEPPPKIAITELL